MTDNHKPTHLIVRRSPGKARSVSTGLWKGWGRSILVAGLPLEWARTQGPVAVDFDGEPWDLGNRWGAGGWLG